MVSYCYYMYTISYAEMCSDYNKHEVYIRSYVRTTLITIIIACAYFNFMVIHYKVDLH